jgi:hypothetical protein
LALPTLPDDAQDEWEPPESVEEAEEWRNEIVAEIQAIQAQLGDHGISRDGNGYRMTLAEFEQWRNRAKWALRHKTDELRKVKAWIKEHNRTVGLERPYAEMTVHQLKMAILDLTTELCRRATESGENVTHE